uniref:Uncharacterized protein n=1 Tax=Rhizophora mucronata TaxID=61149 RepID=A0A2P2ML10_RHIMU
MTMPLGLIFFHLCGFYGLVTIISQSQRCRCTWWHAYHAAANSGMLGEINAVV